MKKSLHALQRYFFVTLFTMASVLGWGQTTIVSDGLNNSSSLFTVSGGTYYTGNSATGDSPASSPFAIEGTHSYGISNGTATLTSSSNIDTSLYTGVSMSFRLASFSIGSTANGAEAADIVTVEVSPNGGANWYSTVRVMGNNNAYWAYSATGNASTVYDGNATPVDFQPVSGGSRTSDGYSTITITGLPSVTNLRFRITLSNNDAKERWVIDDFKVQGTLSGVYSVASGDWNTGSTWNTGTVPTASDNVTITAGHTVTTSSAITRDNTTTVNGVLALTNNLAGTTSVTVNGTFQINSSITISKAPIYNANSILKYNTNGTYARSLEWDAITGTIGTTPGYPYDVQVSNNTTLNYANGSSSTFIAGGSVTIDSGSALYQNYSSGNAGLSVAKDVTVNGSLALGTSSGDLYLGGNFTMGSSANLYNNGRAVFFNGTANQTITKTGGGSIGFDYFVINKTAGNVVLSSSPATDVSINASSGNVLQLINTGNLDLNGRTMSFNNSGGGIYVDGARTITSAVAGGSIAINQYKYVANNAGVGSLIFDTNVVVNLNANGNLDFGKSGSTYISTLKGTLSINSTTSCFVKTNPPIYFTNSLLKYNSGGTYKRSTEWISTVSPAGIPYDVQLSNNTTLNYINPSNVAPQTITNNLTIDSGSSFYMDYGSTTCGGALTIGNNLVSAGNMTLGFASGDDLKVGGNITFNAGYSFYAKTRAVFFTKAGTQVVTASSKPTFHYVVFSGATTTVQLATGTSLDITAPNASNIVSFNAVTNVFDINGNTLTLGTAGVGNTISGMGKFKGSATSNLTLLGSGSIGTLNMDTTSAATQTLGTLTINRQASTIAAVLGTPLVVNSTLVLTNGIVDLGANMLTLGTTSSAGTLTGGSSSSYVIADKTIGGSFKRFTPTASSYTFPIGDASGTADGTQYSPATVNLTSATLASAYLQMNVEDYKEPNNEATTDFINRYWNLNGSGVTNATYNFTGTYLPVDIVGTESTSKSGRYATSSGWTEGANLSSNTVSLTGLTTTSGAINTTADTNHFTGGFPFKKAEINIKQGATTYITGSTYAFGNVEINTNKDITFTIENLGIENLNLGAATISGSGFTLLTNYTTPVAGSSTTTFVIRFTPNALSTFSGSISIPNNDTTGAENPYVINFSGTGIGSALTDIIAAGTEQNTISSTVNNTAITDNTKGVQVWQFTIRDGGAAGDNDNLPSILTSLNIAKSAFSAVNDWRDAIYSIGLFDGSTLLATGTVSSATQIQFTGLNVNVSDNSSKTLSVRLSLKCLLGAGALDGDDFVFSISNTNATFSNTGSGSAAFSAAVSTDAKNVIDVTATHLAFIIQPMTTAVSQTMPTVKVGAVDDCGNKDKDVSGTISITSTGSLLTSPLTATLTSGVATFNTIVHTVVDTNRTLSATNGTLTVTSNPFDIIATNNFEKGDFVVVGVNSNISSSTCTNPTYPGSGGSYSSGADEISFFSFKNIYNGDTFFITDNGYERVNAAQWGDTEGVYKIVRTGGTIGAGTVVTFWLRNETPFMEFISPDSGWTMTKDVSFSANNVVLNTGGDQIYFMQGGSWSNPAGTHDAVYTPGAILFAFNTNKSWKSLEDSTQQSGLYPGMRCFSVLPNAATDFIEYTGPVTPASRRDWIERINNPNNWTDRISCGGYTRTHVDQVYTILNGTTVNGLWRGSSDSNWFDCSNWDTLVVPDQNTNVTFNATVANNAVIDYTAADSDLYGDIARVLNLNIDKPLTIEGNTNNKLEVYGNLTINAGGTLDMDDGNTATQDGQIYLYGNWNNNAGEANFLQGQSTVHLLGSTPQIINGNNHSNVEKFGNLVLGNNFDTAVSNDLYMDGNLTVNANKALVINTSGNYVEVVGNVTNNGTLTVENDGNFIQRDGTYSGNNITVKREALLKRLDYNYWGSPVAGQNVRNFSLGTLINRFYVYNESNDYFDGLFVHNTYPLPVGGSSLTPTEDPATYNFLRGKGYAVRAPNTFPTSNTTFKGTFVGVPNNGNISVAINKSPDTSIDGVTYTHGNDLVSNPYPSNINIDKFFDDNPLLEKVAYFWTNINPTPEMQGSQYPKSGYINNYAVYCLTGGLQAPSAACNADNSNCSKTPNNILKVGQGFVVRAKNSGNVIFKNNIRNADNSGLFFNRLANNKDRFWLELKTPLNFVNPILIGYIRGATNTLDQDYDAKLLVEGADSFYSIVDNQKLAIQGKHYPFNDSDVIALGATFYEKGNHTISLKNKEGVFGEKYSIYLHDKQDDVYTDLQKNDYTFLAEKGENKERFEIVYKIPNRNLSTIETDKYSLVIYQAGDNYVVDADKNFESVKITDASGRLLGTIKCGKKQLVIEKNKLPLGLNIFSIIFANEIINKKILVK